MQYSKSMNKPVFSGNALAGESVCNICGDLITEGPLDAELCKTCEGEKQTTDKTEPHGR